MARNEQIYQAAQRYSDSMDEFQRYHTYPRTAFIDGAEWADKHPKEGMVSLSEVCTWLQNNIDDYATSHGVSSDCLIHALCAVFQQNG